MGRSRASQSIFSEYGISLWTLRHPEERENLFQEYYRTQFGKQSRLVLTIAAVLVILFGLGDLTFTGSQRVTMFYIRFAIATPLLVIVSTLIWLKQFKNRIQLLLVIGLACGVIPLNIATYILPIGIGQRYTMALLLMIMFAFTLSRMQFFYAVIASFILFPISIVIEIMKSTDAANAGMYVLYITGGFGIGLATCYLLEYSTRKSFYYQSQLEKLTDQQEQTISKRTAELRKEKEILQKTLIERDALNAELHHQIKNQMQVLSSLISLMHETISKDEFDRYSEVLAHLFEYSAPQAHTGCISLEEIIEEALSFYSLKTQRQAVLVGGGNYKGLIRNIILIGLASFVILDCGGTSGSIQVFLTQMNSGEITLMFPKEASLQNSKISDHSLLDLLIQLTDDTQIAENENQIELIIAGAA